MKLLQKLFYAVVNFCITTLKAIREFPNRLPENIETSGTGVWNFIRNKEDSRKTVADYFHWHKKEILFCIFLALVISGVDKVQHFFDAFALDIMHGAPNFQLFTLAFLGNGMIIFWLCYVFWHKPKRMTIFPGLTGIKPTDKDGYFEFYQKSGNTWRVSATAAIPLLMAGTGLAQSIIKNERFNTKYEFVGKFAYLLNSYPLSVMVAVTICFLILTAIFRPRPRKNSSLDSLQISLWRNLILMGMIVVALLFLFWQYQFKQSAFMFKSIALTMLVFAPPLALTFVLNGFSECLVKSAAIVERQQKEDAAAARQFSRVYDRLMWTSYLTSGIGLLMLNMKSITTCEWFSTLIYPIAMIIFITIVYYQAMDWLSYNLSPLRFSGFLFIMTVLVCCGPQKHYEIKFKAPPQTHKTERASLEKYFLYWLKDRMDQKILGQSTDDKIYLVATEGGGSRAGAWTASVLTGLDSTMQGKFQEQCFAISSISGGSIGTAATLALWDNARQLGISPQKLYTDSTRSQYIGKIFKRNYISTALAGFFFFDGFQQNILFSWMYEDQYSRTDRHLEEENDAVYKALLEVFGENARPSLHPRYLAETDYLSLYYHLEQGTPRIGLPLYFPNTCRVEEGRRGVCSPIILNTKMDSSWQKCPGNAGLLDIIGEKDRTPKVNMRLSLGEATSLSQLFPFVNSTVHIDTKIGTFMDGGIYENMGLTTLYEIRSALSAIQADPDTAQIQQLFPDIAQCNAFIAKLKAVKFEFVFIYNTEHLDHYEHPYRERTVQFLDPITTLLQTPFGGHTDYMYHKTKMDFAKESKTVEFPLLLLNHYNEASKLSRKASDPIIMSRWLSRHEMHSILDSAEHRISQKGL